MLTQHKTKYKTLVSPNAYTAQNQIQDSGFTNDLLSPKPSTIHWFHQWLTQHKTKYKTLVSPHAFTAQNQIQGIDFTNGLHSTKPNTRHSFYWRLTQHKVSTCTKHQWFTKHIMKYYTVVSPMAYKAQNQVLTCKRKTKFNTQIPKVVCRAKQPTTMLWFVRVLHCQKTDSIKEKIHSNTIYTSVAQNRESTIAHSLMGCLIQYNLYNVLKKFINKILDLKL